jgi:hypothetical protein
MALIDLGLHALQTMMGMSLMGHACLHLLLNLKGKKS